MIRLLCATFFIFIFGCAGPRFNAKPLPEEIVSNDIRVLLIMNSKTRKGFLDTMEEWLASNGYDYVVVPDNSEHQENMITIDYFGRWSWDVAIFLGSAEIRAFHKGLRVGHVGYEAPDTFNPAKFGKGAQRVKYMMEILFGRLSPDEALQKINTPSDVTKSP
jgi:hypothetical protein